jgi:hypothetical protein
MRSTSRAETGSGPSLHEVLAVWALVLADTLAVVVTYSRIPPEELWNVSVGGIAGGLGRALVLLNFPIALIAIALAAIAADRLGRRGGYVVAAAALPLCFVVAVPGVVEAGDVDAKPVNAVPAMGVALALALTLYALVSRGVGLPTRRARGDRVRVVVALVALAAALPWLAAELGFYLGLGGVFMSDEIVPEPGHPELRAVHLGHHHGTAAFTLLLTGLLLSRQLGRLRSPGLQIALTAYVALMLVYGVANMLDDFWLEQVVKRGASDFVFPGMLQPRPNLAWLLILAASAAVYALLRRSAGRPPLSA